MNKEPNRNYELADDESKRIALELEAYRQSRHEQTVSSGQLRLTSVRLDPLREAELARRPAYTSPYSGQDIGERSG